MKVLISGGAGFIGSNLQTKLLSNAYQVAILDNLSKQIHGDIPKIKMNKAVAFHRGDVRSLNDWMLALEDVEIVIHLAAETGTGQSMYEMKKYIQTNSLGTAQLFNAIRELKQKSKVKKIILSSSRAVYGEGAYECKSCKINNFNPEARAQANLQNRQWDHFCEICGNQLIPIPTKEDIIPKPASIYAATKLEQENIIKICCQSMNIDFTIFRFQNVYGAGQSLKNPYTGLLTVFTNQLLNKKDIQIYEDGNETRDFVHVNDVCDAIILAVMEPNKICDIFNVGFGKQTSITEVAKLLIDKHQTNGKLIYSNKYRLGDIRHNFASLDKIAERFSFLPKVKFEQGLDEFYNWTKTQAIEIDNYDKTETELINFGLMNK